MTVPLCTKRTITQVLCTTALRNINHDQGLLIQHQRLTWICKDYYRTTPISWKVFQDDRRLFEPQKKMHNNAHDYVICITLCIPEYSTSLFGAYVCIYPCSLQSLSLCFTFFIVCFEHQHGFIRWISPLGSICGVILKWNDRCQNHLGHFGMIDLLSAISPSGPRPLYAEWFSTA